MGLAIVLGLALVNTKAGRIGGGTATPCLAGPGHPPGGNTAAAPVLPPEFGGVQRFSIPGSFARVPPSSGDDRVAGVLHFYLKAGIVGGETRMKGLALFEFVDYPPHFLALGITQKSGILNVPEMDSLRVGVRSEAQGWERSVALKRSMCSDRWIQHRRQPSKEYRACVADAQNATTARNFYRMPDVYLNFGRLANSTDVNLFVHGWPRFVSLAPLLAAAQTLPADPLQPPSSPPTFVQHLPYPRGMAPELVAQVLTWRAEHHVPLGIPTSYLYVRPRDQAALAAQPTIRRLVAAGQLQLVSWGDFSFFEDWDTYDLSIQAAHGVLSFWGTNTRVWVADLDEFIVTHLDVPTMLGSSKCLPRRSACYTMHRYDVVLGAASTDGALREPTIWRTPGHSPLLTAYRQAMVVADEAEPKTWSDPNNVFPVTLHLTTACTGGNDTKSPCSTQVPCAPVRQQCAWIAHILHMFTAQRRGLGKDAVLVPLGPGWLIMANQSRFW